MKRYEVLVNKSNPEAIEKVRGFIADLSDMKAPEYENNTHIRFECFGDITTVFTLMALGAGQVIEI